MKNIYKTGKKLILLFILISLLIIGCVEGIEDINDNSEYNSILEEEYYYSYEDVALYINTYAKLPENYITKKQAQEAG